MKTASHQEMRRASLAAMTLASVALGLAACKRSAAPDETAPPAPPVPAASNRTAATPASGWQQPVIQSPPGTSSLTKAVDVRAGSNAPSARTPATPEQVQRLATLAQSFRSATTFDNRFDVVLDIAKVGGAEAVQMLEGLFRQEKDGELKVELINALIDINGCKDEKFSLLRLGIGADQPGPVREAAIDGLVDLAEARSLPLLQQLSGDADEKLRAVARHGHDLLTEMLKGQ